LNCEPRRAVLRFAWNVLLALTTIYFLQYSIISA
jgi:hypothetical protein